MSFILGEQGSKILFALLFAGIAGRFTYNTVAEMADDLFVRDKWTRAIAALLACCIMIAWVGGQGLATHGYLSAAEAAACLPARDRLAKGPVAVIECVQNIPCNPCEAACPARAITVGQPITALPVLDALAGKAQDNTAVVTVRMPGELINTIMAINVERSAGS